MQLPDTLAKHLHEQLADQADSDDAHVTRGSALGWGVLGRRQRRDAELRRGLELPAPDGSKIEGAREELLRGAVCVLLRLSPAAHLATAREQFEAALEAALPDLPDDLDGDVATEPLRLARQARAGLSEVAFLAGEYGRCRNEAELARELIPPYLLYQPHRKGYPHEFMARGMAEADAESVAQGTEMQEEFLQYALDVSYLKPWEDVYLVAYTLARVGRRWLDERGG
tara:strand:+ start:2369 stop:3049 length:681 start_codon:yes stop_codon:yes gene_type:complete